MIKPSVRILAYAIGYAAAIVAAIAAAVWLGPP